MSPNAPPYPSLSPSLGGRSSSRCHTSEPQGSPTPGIYRVTPESDRPSRPSSSAIYDATRLPSTPDRQYSPTTDKILQAFSIFFVSPRRLKAYTFDSLLLGYWRSCGLARTALSRVFSTSFSEERQRDVNPVVDAVGDQSSQASNSPESEHSMKRMEQAPVSPDVQDQVSHELLRDAMASLRARHILYVDVDVGASRLG
ncbi:hypothetical protein L202_07143 [Cryptococcus amylolentus CBS 6039]|uniref:Uncharacterized protein n=1 Tax=Cryptococcus amylolentus CBS 6039 TaxID=1295533 RepID=A0A1E3HES9_9TREE|nr:hypothetical protein L202_07143 [Cryptococcus amylolentus CBS 6039]ODN74837.1 hypothetical protein L202_07143 [Cryptococcus amylolentus CBS 6039]